MVDILLLLSQKVGGDRVQGVGGELVVSLDGCHQVKLDAAIDRDLLVVVRPICFAAELRIPHPKGPIAYVNRLLVAKMHYIMYKDIL